jgi:LPXTG-motif cell wall-anchored protein
MGTLFGGWVLLWSPADRQTKQTRTGDTMSTQTLLIIIVLVLLLGGGGFYFR